MSTADQSEVVHVQVGDRAVLNCSTSEPVYWWFKKTLHSGEQEICAAGHMVNGFEKDGRYTLGRSTPIDSGLVIHNVTKDNSGFYSCAVGERAILRILQLQVSSENNAFIHGE